MPHHMPQPRAHIGEPPNTSFKLLSGIVHHQSVKPGAAHDEERVFGFFVAAGVGHHPNSIYRLLHPVKRNIDAGGDITHRQVQVAGEQVTGAQRDNTKSRLRPL